MAAAFAGLVLGPADEAFVADNSVDGVMSDVRLPPGWQVVRATREGSCAHPRNTAALRATGEWFLFIDADTEPAPDLLDRFFIEPIPDDVGVIGGTVLSDESQKSLAARWADTRLLTTQQPHQGHPFRPFVIGACILARRAVWLDVGGFLEGIFFGEDVDFCWRAQEAGWKLQVSPHATVVHLHRESVKALVKQLVSRGASSAWVYHRWPHAARPVDPGWGGFFRALVAAPVHFVAGQRERAGLRALDVATQAAGAYGTLRHNRARPFPTATPPGSRRPVEVWCDQFPVVSETFVHAEARALAALGHPVHVVALRRPEVPAIGVHDVNVSYFEDETWLERRTALARVALRHPLRCLRDLVDRRRWRREEPVDPLHVLAPSIRRLMKARGVHVHAHFAAGAAMDAMRAARIAGRPWSLTAHGYDIYKLPRNLAEKAAAADFVTSGCDYTVGHLRDTLGSDRVHRIVMGVDPERFSRRTPHPPGRTVLAVGRLEEKKGFVHLVRAAAEEPLAGKLDRLVIVGEGPQRAALEAEIDRLGLGEVVELRGRAEHGEVRDLLEDAAVLAMPCVVASDGDRDSMPVVVKEALAMEVPVVASDEVGLPELVRPEFGRLVPPADPAALADALRELLDLSPEQRAALGHAGRRYVSEHANLATESARLSELIG